MLSTQRRLQSILPQKHTSSDVGESKKKHRMFEDAATLPISDYWLQVMSRMLKKKEAQEASERKSRNIRSRAEVLRDTGWATQECQGDKRVRDIQEMLQKGFGYTRSEHQVMFHQFFLQACLPKIYGEEWPDHSQRVLEQFELKKIDSEVMIITARRWGKSMSVAMFVLALMLCVPGIQICIFSTGSRASGSLYDIMMSMLSRMPDAFARIVRNTKEHLFIASQTLPKSATTHSAAAKKLCAAKDTSKLYAFPDTVKGNTHTHSRPLRRLDPVSNRRTVPR